MIVTADLNLELLYQVREKGSVTTWRDRCTDLYQDGKQNKLIYTMKWGNPHVSKRIFRF